MHIGPRLEFLALGAPGAGAGDKSDADVAQAQRVAAGAGATVVVDGARAHYVAVGQTEKVPQEAAEDLIAVGRIIEETSLNVGHAEVDMEGVSVDIDTVPAQVLIGKLFAEASVDEFAADTEQAEKKLGSLCKAFAAGFAVD